MHSTWKSLIWKEWHEHKWVLAALTCITTIVFGVFSFALFAHVDAQDIRADEAGPVMWMVVNLPMALLAVYVAAMEASGEQERGTYGLWQSLPVPMIRVATCKVIFGLLTCLVPGFAAALAVWACPGSPIRATVSLTDLFALTIGSANYYAPASIFIWSIVLAMHGRDEIGAVARALALILGLWTLLLISRLFWLAPNEQWDMALIAILAAMPGGIYVVQAGSYGANYWNLVLAALVVHVALITWFCLRYGRSVTSQVVSRSPSVGTVSMASVRHPFRARWLALLWKQCREGAPIAVAIFAGVVALSAVYTFRDWHNQGWHNDSAPKEPNLQWAAQGFLLACLLVGISTYHRDLTPPLNTFWRSRPIDEVKLYWIKWFTGLGVIGTFTGLGVAMYFGVSGFCGEDQSQLKREVATHILTMGVAVYVAAVTITYLVRHGLYAAILSFAVTLIPFCVIASIPSEIRERLGHDESLAYDIMIAANILVTGVGIVIGWLAVKHDWGWKKPS